MNINKYEIKLQKDEQPFHRPIHNLGPVELKIFKSYIVNNLAHGFI